MRFFGKGEYVERFDYWADALKHRVQDEILEVIEGNDTKIEAVEYAKV